MASRRDLSNIEQLAMLAILRRAPTAYGVNIKEEICDRTGRSISITSLYSALDRLEDQGYLVSKYGEASAIRGGARPLYYWVTSRGSAVLKKSLGEIDALRNLPNFGGGELA